MLIRLITTIIGAIFIILAYLIGLDQNRKEKEYYKNGYEYYKNEYLKNRKEKL